MAEQQKKQGRPVSNKMERIPAPPEKIARAIFREAEKKLAQSKKPN